MFQEKFSLPKGVGELLTMGSLQMMLFGRFSERSGLLGKVAMIIYLMMSRRRGIQIDFTERIGGGLVLAHAYGITVNHSAVLGEKVMLFKGSTIGGIRSGCRKGCQDWGIKWWSD